MSKKDPRPYTREGIGILNHMGDLWSPEVFTSEEKARKYVEGFWGGVPAAAIGSYRYVPVKQVTEVLPLPPSPTSEE